MAAPVDVIEIDDVVETAVSLPEFGRDEGPRTDRLPKPGWWPVALKITGVALAGVVAMAAAVLDSDRGTIPGPSSTATATFVVETPIPFDPLHGVIAPGLHTVGDDLEPGHYVGIVDAVSILCSWTLHEKPTNEFWKVKRSQNTPLTTTVDLTVVGQTFESTGCHWRRRA